MSGDEIYGITILYDPKLNITIQVKNYGLGSRHIHYPRSEAHW
jgi:hypothetical protein